MQARRYLAKEGYDPAMGARPLARIIQERIKQPLAEEILFGALVEGGVVSVEMDDQGALAFTYTPHDESSRHDDADVADADVDAASSEEDENASAE